MADAPTLDLGALPLDERAELIQITPCRALHTPKAAIDFALGRFHETWSLYRSVTPTLYALSDGARGHYVTLGRLRARYGVRWATVDAVVELLEARHAVTGYLLATLAVGGEPARPLFALQGHHQGERHYGALDLSALTPHEGGFDTELDLSPEAWQDRWLEAATNSGLR